jgi:hypothetical protein
LKSLAPRLRCSQCGKKAARRSWQPRGRGHAAYLIPELKRWTPGCPLTERGLVFRGEPDARGERGPIDADKLLRQVLQRALRRAGLPPLQTKWKQAAP